MENLDEGSGSVIRFYENSDYNTITNCIIKGGSSANAGTCIWVGDQSNHTAIINNKIYNALTGIRFDGPAEGIITGGSVIGNDIGDNTDALSISITGIETSNADSLVIAGNDIFNITNQVTSPTGILVGNYTLNSLVSGNIISGIKYAAEDGFGGKGIDVMTGNQPTNLLVVNNAVSDISGDGWSSLSGDAIVGIRIGNGSNGISVFYNSVNLFGQTESQWGDCRSAALYVGYEVSDISIANNALRNSIADTNISSIAYAVYSDSQDTLFPILDYNDYFAAGDQAILGHFMYSDAAQMSDWQLLTGQDENSFSLDPQYLGNTNLRPGMTSPLIGAGLPLPMIIDSDITGAPRDITIPTIGAYEAPGSSTVKTLTVVAFLEGLYNSGIGVMNKTQDCLDGETPFDKFTDATSDTLSVLLANPVDPWEIVYEAHAVNIDVNGNAVVPDIPESISGDYYIVLKHRQSVETWSGQPVSLTDAEVICDFTSDPSMAFGSNLKEAYPGAGIYTIFGGEITSMFGVQDGYVDIFDNNEVFNQAQSGAFGYMSPDVTGDGFVDIFDMVIVFNNMQGGAGMNTPPFPLKK